MPVRYDEQGHSYTFNQGQVILHLKDESRGRNIGHIDYLNRTYTTSRSKAKHLHRKSYSYGFNEFLINNATQFDKVQINETAGNKKTSYLIPIKVIQDEGFYLHHKKANQELQIFLNLETITKYKT